MRCLKAERLSVRVLMRDQSKLSLNLFAAFIVSALGPTSAFANYSGYGEFPSGFISHLNCEKLVSTLHSRLKQPAHEFNLEPLRAQISQVHAIAHQAWRRPDEERHQLPSRWRVVREMTEDQVYRYAIRLDLISEHEPEEFSGLQTEMNVIAFKLGSLMKRVTFPPEAIAGFEHFYERALSLAPDESEDGRRVRRAVRAEYARARLLRASALDGAERWALIKSLVQDLYNIMDAPDPKVTSMSPTEITLPFEMVLYLLPRLKSFKFVEQFSLRIFIDDLMLRSVGTAEFALRHAPDVALRPDLIRLVERIVTTPELGSFPDKWRLTKRFLRHLKGQVD